MKDTVFFKQAELLLKILPLIHEKEMFALKGGTAINFFVRDLPRLSVDIDLSYLPIKERENSLNDIYNCLLLISKEIRRRMPGIKIIQKIIKDTTIVNGLIIDNKGLTVKIEPNLVFRGSVYQPEIKSLSKKAQDLFELSVQSRILSPNELYAGKICAALDRQHPRDLFDVHFLLKNEGLNPEIRRAFIVYLVGHPRPMVELLNPRKKDIKDTFEKEFKDMVAENISIEILEKTRDDLIEIILHEFTADERKFLVSIKELKPRWDLLALEGVKNLPAIKWKLLNISKMTMSKHQKAVYKLRDYLEV